jgi:4-hydroxy-3-polyprenylbenzoate decarboxylase
VSYNDASKEMNALGEQLAGRTSELTTCPMIVICDDSTFTTQSLRNFLWVTFTRCNPSHDIHGLNSFYENKHWGCTNLVVDARIKPHHAPVLEKDPAVEKKIDRLFDRGGSLYGVLK